MAQEQSAPQGRPEVKRLEHLLNAEWWMANDGNYRHLRVAQDYREWIKDRALEWWSLNNAGNIPTLRAWRSGESPR